MPVISLKSAEQSPARRRVVLGSNAHRAITAALRERLTDIEAQRGRAHATDSDDIIATRS